MTPSPALTQLIINCLSDWQWAPIHERWALKIRAEHLVKLIDEQRAKEAAEGREKAA